MGSLFTLGLLDVIITIIIGVIEEIHAKKDWKK